MGHFCASHHGVGAVVERVVVIGEALRRLPQAPRARCLQPCRKVEEP